MTAPVNTNILQQIAGGNASNATGVAGAQGLFGATESGATNTDFISLILAKLQGEGVTPVGLQNLATDGSQTALDADVNVPNGTSQAGQGQGATLTSEPLTIENLSEKLTAILAELSSPADKNGQSLPDVALNQGALGAGSINGQASAINGQSLPDTALTQSTLVAGALNGLANGQASGLLNNPILAQQLGLDPQSADAPEIIATIQNLLGEIGIHTGKPINADSQAQNPNSNPNAAAATLETRTVHTTSNVLGEQSPILNPNSETFSAKNDIPAHLTIPTSSQKSGQDASPALQSKATPNTSPQYTQTNPKASPKTGLDSVVSVTTGEAPSIQVAQASLQNAQAELQQSQNELLNGFANTTSAAPQSFVAADAVERPINQGQDKTSQKKPVLGAAPQATTTARGAATSSASPLGATSPNASAKMTATLLTTPNTSQNAMLGVVSGADSAPEFTLGQDFSNSLSFDGQKLDGEITQNLKFDGLNTASQRASTSTPAQARFGGSHAPNVRAAIINMTRGADKAIDRLSLQLDPMELGRVEVELKMGKDGVLKASIMADKPEALQILQKDSNALQKALQDAGLDVGSDSFTFDLRDQSKDQFAQDKDSREMLFNINGLDDIDTDLSNVNDNMHYGEYGKTYASADGVNIFV